MFVTDASTEKACRTSWYCHDVNNIGNCRVVIVSSSWRSNVLWNDPRPSSESSTATKTITTEIDVSDLGLTMDDLNAPLPKDLFQVIETSGYESTSRIPSVDDDACFGLGPTSHAPFGSQILPSQSLVGSFGVPISEVKHRPRLPPLTLVKESTLSPSLPLCAK